jgi:arabinofuranan 3-O-arabinosyltransferase
VLRTAGLRRRLIAPTEVPQLTRPFPRWLFPAVAAVALVVFCLQEPGKIVFETKLDLVHDPSGFMGSLFRLWSQERFFGVLQDQYQGYAWPMGPFYLLAHSLGISTWLQERIWDSLVFSTALTGMVRLLEELSIGHRATRLLAGLAYALWPTYTMLIGSTSGAILPGVLVPYMLVFLLKAFRHEPPTPYAALAGATVSFMGGINATSTLDCLVLPAALFLTRPIDVRWMRVGRAFVLSLAVAIAWWFFPLVFLGAYGFNFLPYVEQAHTTTATMSATEALRGMGNWTGYLLFGFLHNSALEVLTGAGNPAPSLDLPHPWLSAGWILATNPLAIAGSIAVAATGLAGLALRDMPARQMFRLSATIVLFLLLAGYCGKGGSLLSQPIQAALDGLLSPFRNIYKFNPALGVALSAGFCHSLTRLEEWMLEAGGRLRSLAPRIASPASAMVLLVPLALPYLEGQAMNPGGFSRIPSYWHQAVSYLRYVSPYNTTLVVPAADQGIFTWGSPIDDPMEVLNAPPWTALDQVPFGGAGSRRLLDAIQWVFKSGVVPQNLNEMLYREGIHYLLVRNDIDWRQFDDPSPAKVHAVLDAAGFPRVAGFGPLLPSQDFLTASKGGSVPASPPRYQALEVYRVPPPGPAQGSRYPVFDRGLQSSLLVSGGPEATADMVALGLLGPGQAFFLAGDKDKPRSGYAGVVATDTLQRREVDFGLLNDNSSYVLARDEPPPPESPGGEGRDRLHQILPFKPDSHQTYAVYDHAVLITASSYGSWYFSLPYAGPYSAFDGREGTAWVTGTAGNPVGQWIKVRFPRPVSLPYLGVELLEGDLPNRPKVLALTVTTDNGSATSKVKPTDSLQYVAVPTGPTRTLTLSFAKVKGYIPGGPGAGIREILLPGLTINRYLRLPKDYGDVARSAPVAFLFDASPENPDFSLAGRVSDMARQFWLPHGETLSVKGFAIPLPSPQLGDTLSKVLEDSISASSVFGGLPRFYPQHLLEQGFPGAWISEQVNPSLTIRLSAPATFSAIHFLFTSNIAARPLSVTVQTESGVRKAAIGRDGWARFDALSASSTIKLSFTSATLVKGIDPLTGYLRRLPVGLRGIEIPGVPSLSLPAPSSSAPFELGCGEGPTIYVDGRPIATRVSGTVEDLLSPGQLKVQACTRVDLGPGWHTLVADPSPSAMQPSVLALVPAGWPAAVDSSPAANVQAFSDENVDVNVPSTPQARVISLGENFNPGWQARIGSTALKPVVVDGWQQGFVVPAGASGHLSIRYEPAFLYRISFGAALFALGVLFLVCAALWFRYRPTPLFSGPPREAAFLGDWALLGLLLAVLGVVAGPLAVLVLLASQLLYNLRHKETGARFAGLAAFAALDIVVSAIQPGTSASSGTGSFSLLAQVAAVGMVAFALAPALNWFRGPGGAIAEVVYYFRRRRFVRWRRRHPIPPVIVRE